MDAIDEFEKVLNSITGLYVDSHDAYALLQAKIELEAEGKNWDSPIYYGDGPAGAVNCVAHTTTIAERIGRNAEGAENSTFIGNMALVTIYSYWEDHFREQIATAKGVAKHALRSDVMGDIRRLRQSIIHHGGIATDETGSCKVLTWFARGDEIYISEQMFLQLISCVRVYLEELRSSR